MEAVVEDHDVKARLHAELDAILDADAILATTTSSLSVQRLADASGRPDRFLGLHVFNPVTKMQLIELIFPSGASAETRARTLALCEDFEKTPVEVPDIPGFVVNRLLFPYLFSAVRLLEETGMDPEDIDTCMRLGAGHPMGPLALLDLVGLDVSGRSARRSASPSRTRAGADRRGRARAQERARTPQLLTPLFTNLYERSRGLLAQVHRRRDTCMCDVKSHRTPASSQCARSGPLPPRAGRV